MYKPTEGFKKKTLPIFLLILTLCNDTVLICCLIYYKNCITHHFGTLTFISKFKTSIALRISF